MTEWGVHMGKSQNGFVNSERRRFKQLSRNSNGRDFLLEWEQGAFESRLGTNFQAIDAPQKRSLHYEWEDGKTFRKSGHKRKTLNAKAKKPIGKKYYRKARSRKEDLVQKHRCALPNTIYRDEERRLHSEWVMYRGGYFATCKGCERPMPQRGLHNSDMAICYECTDGLEWLYDWYEVEDDEELTLELGAA